MKSAYFLESSQEAIELLSTPSIFPQIIRLFQMRKSVFGICCSRYLNARRIIEAAKSLEINRTSISGE
jgi:hypothetical protein